MAATSRAWRKQKAGRVTEGGILAVQKLGTGTFGSFCTDLGAEERQHEASKLTAASKRVLPIRCASWSNAECNNEEHAVACESKARVISNGDAANARSRGAHSGSAGPTAARRSTSVKARRMEAVGATVVDSAVLSRGFRLRTCMLFTEASARYLYILLAFGLVFPSCAYTT